MELLVTVVILTIFGGVCDENFIKITFPFQCKEFAFLSVIFQRN